MAYYYRGCPSWGWFYPFHYAPMTSDLIDLTSYPLSFELGTPFRYDQAAEPAPAPAPPPTTTPHHLPSSPLLTLSRTTNTNRPFQQLLGCLPAASSKFLPSSYANLMCNAASPLIEYYPDVTVSLAFLPRAAPSKAPYPNPLTPSPKPQPPALADYPH